MSHESDSAPLDGEPELTAAERKLFREWVRDREHVNWLGRTTRRFFRRWWPVLAIIATALYGAVDWYHRHYKP